MAYFTTISWYSRLKNEKNHEILGPCRYLIFYAECGTYKGKVIASIIIIVKQETIWRKLSLPKWRHSPHVLTWSEMYGRDLSDNIYHSFSFLSLLYAFLSLLSYFTTLLIVSRNESTITDEWRVAKNSDGSRPGLIQTPVWQSDASRHGLSQNIL
jgi:hypothetical protein